MNAEKDLLLGVFAVQLGLVTSEQAMAAASGWAADRSQGLAERLITAGGLDSDKRALLDDLVATALAAHGGDPVMTLATLGGSATVSQSFSGSVILDASGIARPADAPAKGTAAVDPGQTGQETRMVTREHAGRYRSGGRESEAAGPSELGRGGIGRVLLAFDEHIGREVAIKELLPGRLGTPSADTPMGRTSVAVARFLREARVCGQLEHPNIVPVYELGERPDKTLYYTMKVVRGRTLTQAFAACRNMVDRLGLLSHFIALCQAVAFAHSRGVVHRDIKPDNVMVGEFGETVVLDWGLAKVRGRSDLRGSEIAQNLRRYKDSTPGQTMDGSAIGTPAYMSPEQADGRLDQIDERSDVWSLGAVLYELLTGRPPYEGVSAYEVIGKVLSKPVEPVRVHAPDAPGDLASVCEKALAREPDQRYAAARELAADVSAFTTGGRVKAYEYRLGELFARFAARHKAPLLVGVVGLVALLVIGVLSYRQVVAERGLAMDRLAESLQEGAQSALIQGDPLQARAKLRGALEVDDRVAARVLWQHLEREPLRWGWTLGAPVVAVAYSPDGRSLVVSGGTSLFLLDASTRAVRRVLRGHTSTINAVDISPDGRYLASGGQDRALRLWDLSSPSDAPIAELGEHAQAIYGIRFSPDGRYLASASADGKLRLWRAPPGPPGAARLVDACEKGCMSLAFDPAGRYLASGGADGQVRLWDLPKLIQTSENKHVPQAVASLPGHKGWVFGLDFSPDGQRLGSAALDRRVMVRKVPSGEQIWAAEGHAGLQWALRFSSDGRRLATSGADRQVILWNAETGQRTGALTGFGDRVYGISFSPDGRSLAAGSSDERLTVWRLDVGQASTHGHGHTSMAMALAFSPDGKSLASSGQDGSVRLWRVATGEQVRVIQHQGPVSHVAFAPSGGGFFSVAEGVIHQWGPDGQQRRVFGGHASIAGDFVIQPDGSRMAVLGQDGRVRLWQIESAELAARLPGEWGSHPLYSPDGRLLAVGASSGEIVLFDARSLTRVKSLVGHTRVIFRMAFDATGERLASTGYDQTLRIWDLATGKNVILNWPGADQHAVYGFEFSPDGRELVIGTSQGWIWRCPLDGSPARGVPAHGSPIYGLQHSPDGSKLATCGADGTLRLWQAETLRAVWSASTLLRSPLALFSHRGLQALPGGQSDPSLPAPGTAVWRTAAESRAIKGAQDPLDGDLCLFTHPEGLELWNPAQDRLLASARLADVTRLLAISGGCAALTRSGRVEWLDNSRSLRSLAAERATAIAYDDAGLLIASRSKVAQIPAGRAASGATWSAGPGTSAMLRVGQDLLLGYSDGTFEWSRPDGGRSPVLLQRSPASEVTRIVAGPVNTLAVGFANGEVGLWDPQTGTRLEHAKLHGRLVHLLAREDRLVAATDLGDLLVLDLFALTADYCDLLRRVWREVPIAWRAGRAVDQPAPSDHPCTSQTAR